MRFRIGVLFLLVVLFLSACSREHKLARNFLNHKENKGSVLVVYPLVLNMFNNNEYLIDSLALPEEISLDSVLFEKTNILKQVSDSVFLENYLNAFIQGLQKIGFTVYLPDELEAFRAAEAPAYVFRFAQLELAEEYFPYEVDENVRGTKYNKIFELNLISLSSWFEFEARDTAWRKVLYAEDAIRDEFEGQFLTDRFTGEPAFYYSIDSLLIKDVYQMATDVGEKYASYLTDFFMNNYIGKHFPADLKPVRFFQYDAELKMLFPFEEGFEEIIQPK